MSRFGTYFLFLFVKHKKKFFFNLWRLLVLLDSLLVFFLQEPDSDTRKWLCFNQFFFFKSTGDLFDFERRMNVNRQSLPLSPSGQSKVQHLKRNAETYVFFFLSISSKFYKQMSNLSISQHILLCSCNCASRE